MEGGREGEGGGEGGKTQSRKPGASTKHTSRFLPRGGGKILTGMLVLFFWV